MKHLPTLLCCLLLALPALRADEAEDLAGARAADDERVAATIAGDRARLEAVFSDGLHYAHSNGALDTKATLVDKVASGRTDYEQINYARREFEVAAPGVVVMRGRALIRAGAPGKIMPNDINFLAVWRREGGKWRFLAWQSSHNPEPAK